MHCVCMNMNCIGLYLSYFYVIHKVNAKYNVIIGKVYSNVYQFCG